MTNPVEIPVHWTVLYFQALRTPGVWAGKGGDGFGGGEVGSGWVVRCGGGV